MRRAFPSRLVVVAAIAVAASACGFTFERQSEVTYRRIVAFRSEPAEIVANGPLPASVRISALVVDPAGGLGEVPVASWTWRACLPNLGDDFGRVDDAGRCALDDEASVLARATGPLDELAVDVPVPVQASFVLQQIANLNQGQSIYLQPQLEIARDGESPLVGVHLVPLSPNVPEGRKPNENPRLIGLLFDGEPWPPDVPMKVEGMYEAEDQKPGMTCGNGRERQVIRYRDDQPELVMRCAHRITPLFDESQAERYTVAEYDGDRRELQELLRFSWFTDHGGFTSQNTQMEQSIGQFSTDAISTEWTEPADQPPVGTIGTVWVVVRDGRGGTTWEKRLIQFD